MLEIAPGPDTIVLWAEVDTVPRHCLFRQELVSVGIYQLYVAVATRQGRAAVAGSVQGGGVEEQLVIAGVEQAGLGGGAGHLDIKTV